MSDSINQTHMIEYDLSFLMDRLDMAGSNVVMEVSERERERELMKNRSYLCLFLLIALH